MILQALYTYLTNPADFTERNFTVPVALGDLTLRHRGDARRQLRNIVGSRFYRARRLNDEGHSAVTMRIVGSESAYHLQGEDPAETTFVQIDHWTMGNGAMSRAALMSELLRLAISSYHGQWDATSILSVTLESQLELPVAPDGVDVYWTARMSQTYKIRWARVAAEYPVGDVVAEGELLEIP